MRKHHAHETPSLYLRAGGAAPSDRRCGGGGDAGAPGSGSRSAHSPLITAKRGCSRPPADDSIPSTTTESSEGSRTKLPHWATLTLGGEGG